jgi:hypothetical protein
LAGFQEETKMIRTAAFLLALTAAPAAFAQNHIGNHQFNNAVIQAGSNTNVHSLHGPLTATSQAGGNTVGANVAGNVSFNNAQFFWGDARATTNVHVGALQGTGVALATAFSNNAELTAASACCISVNNHQAAAIDPTAVTNVSIGYAASPVSAGATAFSNNLTVAGSGWANMSVNSRQLNAAATNAFTNVNIGTIGGALGVQASAIGNSVTLTNIPRD